jgi:hypothetical protein
MSAADARRDQAGFQGLRLATSASKSTPAAVTLRRGPVSLKNTAPFGPSAIAPRSAKPLFAAGAAPIPVSEE